MLVLAIVGILLEPTLFWLAWNYFGVERHGMPEIPWFVFLFASMLIGCASFQTPAEKPRKEAMVATQYVMLFNMALVFAVLYLLSVAGVNL